MSLELQYYVDLPGRDLTIPDAGSVVWVDIEPGCFQDAQDVRDEGTRITQAGFRYGTYCGRYTLPPVFGASEELAAWPLWYADYKPPDFGAFEPFNGWQQPALWQFYPNGFCGINCDLSLTPEGRLFADISNFTDLTPKTVAYFKAALDGVVIGLQSAKQARYFRELLS